MSSSRLPAGWAMASIADVLAPQLDGKILHQGWSPQCEKEPCSTSDEWGVLKTTAIQAGEFQSQHHKRLPSHHEGKPAIEVSPGDLLITCAGPRVRCGVACLVKTTRPRLMLSGKMYRFRAVLGAMDARYLEAFLQTDEAQRAIDQMKTGGSESGLNLTHDRFRQLEVRVAPYQEQCRVVEKLEELLSDLDAGVAELKAAQKKLGQYRQSLLKAAVEGVLTAEWRAAQHAGRTGKKAPAESGAALLARILTERRSRWQTRQLAKFQAQGKAPPKDWQAKYPTPVAPDTTGLPVLPVGWVWASAEQLCDFITKGTTPSKGLTDGGDKVIPFLRVTNLTDKGELDMADKVFVSEETHRGFLARSVVYPSDVLMNIVGPPLGQVSVVPETFPEWNINQAIAIFRAVDGVLSGFLSLTLLSPPAQRWLKVRSKTTAGQTNLTLEVCRSLPIPLPPQAEQVALIAVAGEAINRVAEQAEAIQISFKQSAAQRKNILQAAFSGQLVPQDPADEPASALLARIRTERAARETGAARGRGKKKVTA